MCDVSRQQPTIYIWLTELDWIVQKFDKTFQLYVALYIVVFA